MPRIAFVLTLLAAVALAGGDAAACSKAPQAQLATTPLAIETLRGAHAFTVEVAATAEQKACGLMKRPRLARDVGMLFRNDPPGPAYFWMKNTPQPLDMLFLDAAGRVIHIAEHTTPYSTDAHGTEGPVAAVLEVQAGTAARLAIENGDRVRHAWFK